MKQRVGIAGFRGYSGAELVRILSRHPRVIPFLLEHRSDTPVRAVPLNASGPKQIACTAEAIKGEGLTAVFLATPAPVSMELAPLVLQQTEARVIDLSGAFRFSSVDTYQHWYREEHTAPQFLAEAVYGLPEFYRERVKAARLVANPGCYPTAANLALRPLVAAGVIDRTAGIVCDAKSGVSGAGRKASLNTSFCEVTENFAVYAAFSHKHTPEILQVSSLAERELSFTTQLIPIDRGILETLYFRVKGVSTPQDLLNIYSQSYHAEPFVRLYAPGSFPDIHAVARTNFCDIGLNYDPASGRAVVVAAIDNLVKGAAGQAIQNMNLLLGYREDEGLL